MMMMKSLIVKFNLMTKNNKIIMKSKINIIINLMMNLVDDYFVQ